MTFVPHLNSATQLLFRDYSFDFEFLPDIYHHFGLGVHFYYKRSFSLPVNCRKDPPQVFFENGFKARIDVYDSPRTNKP